MWLGKVQKKFCRGIEQVREAGRIRMCDTCPANRNARI